MDELCFVIIKPDAIERGLVGKIISRLEDTYMRVMHFQELHKTEEWAKLHYAHVGRGAYFKDLVEFMSSRPIISLSVIGFKANERVKKLVGNTFSWKSDVGTIRGDWGNYPARFNLIHSSENKEKAEQERLLFYNPLTTVQE